MTFNPELKLPFPVAREQDDAKRIFAEYAILGGMLRAEDRFICSGASVDWTHPLSEAIARSCVEAWNTYNIETDDAWRCAVGATLSRYTGRSPLSDSAMLSWCQYLMGIYEMQFGTEAGA